MHSAEETPAGVVSTYVQATSIFEENCSTHTTVTLTYNASMRPRVPKYMTVVRETRTAFSINRRNSKPYL